MLPGRQVMRTAAMCQPCKDVDMAACNHGWMGEETTFAIESRYHDNIIVNHRTVEHDGKRYTGYHWACINTAWDLIMSEMDWLDQFDGNPLWMAPPNERLKVAVDKFAGRAGTNEKGWKTMLVPVKIISEGIEDWKEIEIPFWCRASLVQTLKRTDPRQRYVDLWFTRELVDENKSRGFWDIAPTPERRG